jgi:AraC-like DNA-binding protein
MARAGAFVVRDRVLSAGTRLPWHRHDRAHLVFVQSGRFVEETDRARFDCRPGIVLTEHAQTPHRDVVPEPARIFTIELLESAADLPAGVVGESRRGRDGAPLANVAAALLRELADWDAFSAAVVEELCAEAVARVRRVRSNACERVRPGWLTDIAAELANVERTTTVADLARALDVPAYRIQRAFRAVFGESPAQFVRRRKIAAAKELLCGTEPVAQIAARLGFADQSHLGRAFRRHVGITPSSYRARRGSR